MVNIIRQAREFSFEPRKVCLAIGMFDGVHLGHQQVLRHAILDASQHGAYSVAVTFDRHPKSVVAPERTPPLIYSLEQKLRVLSSTRVHTIFLIQFDESFCRMSGENFIGLLARDFGRIQSICVGSTFTFGYRRQGNIQLLKKLGEQLQFTVHPIAAVSLDSKPVSSTLIRESIRAGDLDHASQMLGRPYSISGLVIPGAKIGRSLGFPTANLEVRGRVLPPNGVYAVQVQTSKQTWKGVVNIGCRPTLSQDPSAIQVEVHLLDFDGDLYGQEIEIVPVERLRDEQRFPSPELLRRQIQQDVTAARAILG
jgi:riboflavin kinase / FMN adenylyltransferase